VTLRVEGLTKSYGKALAVNGAELRLASDEFISIVGRSGSGKSTLLGMISALLRPTSGRVLLDEEEIWNFPETKLADLRRRRAEFPLGCFVPGIDHFGKAVETGTRGTSAKEAAADVVIAMLGDRSIAGEVSNTRLAMRKRRSGPAGEEYAFTARTVHDADQEAVCL
jgi:ABC-type cobalamin/Fe3+-siderophores transport system ATPase subunit